MYSETSATPTESGGRGGIPACMWQMAGAAVKLLHTAECADCSTHLLWPAAALGYEAQRASLFSLLYLLLPPGLSLQIPGPQRRGWKQGDNPPPPVADPTDAIVQLWAWTHVGWIPAKSLLGISTLLSLSRTHSLDWSGRENSERQIIYSWFAKKKKTSQTSALYCLFHFHLESISLIWL